MMKTSERLANFVGKLTGMKPARKVAKAVRDPRISEPVWMMLESIRTNPDNWRVQVEVPLFDYDETIRQTVRGITEIPMDVIITDRAVGEVFKASIWVEIGSARAYMRDKMHNRVTEYGALMATGINTHPTWLGIVEARELFYALSEVMAKRSTKVRHFLMRKSIKAAEEHRQRQEQKKNAERDRLTQVYGGK